MGNTWRRAIALSVLFVSCSKHGDFRVVEVNPSPDGVLRRNEPVTIRFSDDVNPSSVTANSVRVLLDGGRPAEGRFDADGAKVVFVPDAVGDASLGDGGYGNADEVSLRIAGFPSRLGVLSAAGEPLVMSFHRHFRVAPLGDGDARFQAFVDPVPGPPRRVGPDAAELVVSPNGALIVEFSEPLFPPSVNPATICLAYDNPDHDAVETELELQSEPRRSRVLVRPAGGFQAGTHYVLQLATPGVRDLVGNPFDGGGRRTEFRVRVASESSGDPGGRP